MMVEFIIDIWSNIADLYQQFFGVPEGITYAFFGAKKKKKKAKEALEEAQKQLGDINIDAEGDGLIPSTKVQIEGLPNLDDETAIADNSISPPTTTYTPEFPYRGNQIIIDSDRVLINSKNDSTFIVGKKAVGISTQGTFNVDSGGKTIINSPEIYLGLEASHPIVQGDRLAIILVEFLKVLDQVVCEDLKIATDSNNTNIATVNRAGKALQKAARSLAKRIPSTLSELVKTQ